nr:unnamed protein product [Digitaria exilis]
MDNTQAPRSLLPALSPPYYPSTTANSWLEQSAITSTRLKSSSLPTPTQRRAADIPGRDTTAPPRHRLGRARSIAYARLIKSIALHRIGVRRHHRPPRPVAELDRIYCVRSFEYLTKAPAPPAGTTDPRRPQAGGAGARAYVIAHANTRPSARHRQRLEGHDDDDGKSSRQGRLPSRRRSLPRTGPRRQAPRVAEKDGPGWLRRRRTAPLGLIDKNLHGNRKATTGPKATESGSSSFPRVASLLPCAGAPPSPPHAVPPFHLAGAVGRPSPTPRHRRRPYPSPRCCRLPYLPLSLPFSLALPPPPIPHALPPLHLTGAVPPLHLAVPASLPWLTVSGPL